jgi:RecJ-like exonuclease
MRELIGLKEVCGFIREKDDFTVVGHYDADGLTASGIAGLFLKRLGKKFSIHNTKYPEKGKMKEIKEWGDNFIFVDLGSGQLHVLEEELSDKEFCIIDHHKPHNETARPQFNPHLSGIDGVNSVSGAGMAYLVARELSKKNMDLAKLAIVGAIGDMQDVDSGRLIGLNKEILKDGEDCGEVRARKDLTLFGRHSRPLTQFLSYSADPFLPGLTANEDNCRDFLHSLGIPLKAGERWNYYIDLDEDQKKRLVSGLYVYGKQHGVPEDSLKRLVGDVYEFPKEPERTELRDAKEFSTLLNACGRHDKTEIGVKVCMGDRDKAYNEAKALLQLHRKMLRDGIEWAQENVIDEYKNMYVIDAGDKIKDTLIGVIAGMLYGTNVIRNDKPVIAVTVNDEGELKISGRATMHLVRNGLDLGDAMKVVAERLGGEGGGHNVAAGARVSPKQKKEFLESLDKAIGEQMKKR